MRFSWDRTGNRKAAPRNHQCLVRGCHYSHKRRWRHSIFVRGVTPLTRRDVRGVPPRRCSCQGVPVRGVPAENRAVSGGQPFVRGVPGDRCACQGGARQGGLPEPEDTMAFTHCYNSIWQLSYKTVDYCRSRPSISLTRGLPLRHEIMRNQQISQCYAIIQKISTKILNSGGKLEYFESG